MSSRSLILISLMGFLFVTLTQATEHIVGGKNGWSFPPTKDYYQQWSQQRKFRVGDKLVFDYTPSSDNVIEVGEKEFEQCTQDDVIDMQYDGHTVVKLDEAGKRYFYCGIALHCESGMKFSVTVQPPS
ncbi:early nodulin-like protein 14 [Aristolochia californica]|uniref:early nodulin-like protein 14 n=1 Tax=Aristolochia californica TaxID=171875 RepID=UPI0035D91DAB